MNTAVSTDTVTLLVDWTGHAVSTADLGRAEQSLAQRLPPWRRREFTRGRLTARAAIAHSSDRWPHAAQTEILRAADGAPCITAKSGGSLRVRVSITHSDPWAAAAVGPAGYPLGVDVEPCDDRNAALVHRLCTAHDRIPAGTDPTLVTACKEAGFKACRGKPDHLRGYAVRVHAPDDITIRPSHGRPECLYASVTWHRGLVLVTVTATRQRPRTVVLPAARVLRRPSGAEHSAEQP